MSKWDDPLPQYLFSGGRVADSMSSYIQGQVNQQLSHREPDFYTPNVQLAGTPAVPPMATMNTPMPTPNIGNLPATGAGPITVDVDTNLPTYTEGQLLQRDRNSTGFRAIDPTQTDIPEVAAPPEHIDIMPSEDGHTVPGNPNYNPGRPGYVPGTDIPGGSVGPAGGIGNIGGPGSIGGAGGWLDFDADSIWENNNGWDSSKFYGQAFNNVGR